MAVRLSQYAKTELPMALTFSRMVTLVMVSQKVNASSAIPVTG